MTMHIQKIEISNVLGLSRADIVCSTPVMMIAGSNEAGKSTIADAVSMAILGTPRRVKLKKDLGQLLHDSADKGRVSVIAGGEVLGEFRLPGGQHKAEPVKGAEFLEFVLDPAAFARQAPADRRTALFKLTGCKMSPDVVEQRLVARGIPEAMAAEIKPLLRGGFPATCDEMKERATQAKGAWRAVTGQNWGSNVAEGWEPELPVTTVDADQLASAMEEHAQLDAELGEAMQALGASKNAASAQARQAETIAQLQEVAGLAGRREAKLAEDKARVEEWTVKLNDAKAASFGEPARQPLSCPCCNAQVELAQGVLVEYIAPEKVADKEAAGRVVEYSGYLQSAERAVQNSQRDLKASQDAIAQIAALKEQAAQAVPSEDAIANAEEVIAELRQRRDAAAAKATALNDAKVAIEGHAKTVAKAAKHHAEVKTYLEIAEALAPDGIPGEILSSALTPVNDSLAVLARLAGWKKVEITEDMEITCGGRLYGLMSESAKWRADALLALVIAQISELRMVILDRFDVLDLPGRSQLLNMLIELANIKAMDTMIMCGTMKAIPEKLPSGVSGVWVQNNIAESAQ